MIEIIKNELKQRLYQAFKLDIAIEEPKKNEYDLSIPLFGIVKQLSLPMMKVFEDVKSVVVLHPLIEDVLFLNGFLNMTLKKDVIAKHVIEDILMKKEMYGSESLLSPETIVIDYSSPNIAKNFSVGHLRSTVIGHALKRIYQKLGYQVVGVNHLGDWGTQFGKMIVAYEKWGSLETIQKDPITELQKLYVRFHEEAETDDSLNQLARDVFKKMEDQDETYLALWQLFKDASLKEFMRMYDLLQVSFESYHGEAFYNDKMDAVIEELAQKGLLKVDDGATIVPLGDDFPPALIKKKDGATLYITRDLAALLYRYRTYHFKKMLYVVGNEQRLHFQQLAKTIGKMGYQFDIEHVNFGLVLVDGKKMSTRSGKYKNLDVVIQQAIQLAKEAILEKNPKLEHIDQVARAIGVGAIVFNDLKNERHLDIEFNLENMLKFEGQTGPYIQYSIVRIESIIRNEAKVFSKVSYDVFKKQHYYDLIQLLDQFPGLILKSAETNMPSVIAKYIITLAQTFNSFYGKERIIVEDETMKETHLALVTCVQTVLKEGLYLLGITPLESM